MANLIVWFNRVKKRHFFRYGLPFLVLVVGGSFGLKQVTSVRYQFRKTKMLTPEDAEKFGVKMKGKEEKPTLESEYQSLTKIPLDSWENIRGPRPWEDSKEIQDQLRRETSKTS